MKKALKITGISLLIIIFLLTIVPFIFQSQIKDMLKAYINENVQAKVEFSDVSLSLLRSFPKAQVTIYDLEIINFEPFKDETLATAKEISFTMSVTELFKNKDESIIINSITVDEALIILKTDALDNHNYDITKEAENVNSSTSESSSFSFNIEDYSINNSAFTFLDETSNTTIYITKLNHSGKGIFSTETYKLDTKTNAKISFTMDSTSYLNNTNLKLDAIIELDFNTNTYTFKDNRGYINNLPLEFQGYIKQLDNNGQEIDITFENPESSFKDFLAIIPKRYSKNLDNVTTTGGFKVKGVIKGVSSNKTIPKLDINIVSNNASFKYPDMPKRVKNISINTSIKNTTGKVDDTYIDVKTFNFIIDEDEFKSSATLKNLTKNMLVNATIDGTLNLGNISKAYPIDLDQELSGTLKAKLNTSFDMNAIETNAYQRILNAGTMSVSNFIFSSEDIVNPIHISNADILFNNGTVTLNNFNAKIGASDFSATGAINNLLGFLLSNKTLQGSFNLNSNNFLISDFTVEDESTSNDNKTISNTESLKIPSFLDCTILTNAKNVMYDNLNLKDVKGILIIKDQKVTLKNMSSRLFDGNLTIDGNVSTQYDIPTFNLNLKADGFDISKSFNGLELLQNLAPIGRAIQGKLNTTINLSGSLDKAFSPNLNSVSGNALAEVLSSTMNPLNAEVLGKLGSSLNFIDFKKIDLKNLKTQFEFANGNVNVKPFSLKYEDIDIEISGSHNFEQSLAYKVVFNVPAKYLGTEVTQLIGKINTAEAKKITIPITANINGSYTNPSINTDLTFAVTNLTKQLIEIEKQKLLNQGKKNIKGLLEGLISDTSTKTDSIKTKADSTSASPITKSVKDMFGDLLRKKKKKKDTINN